MLAINSISPLTSCRLRSESQSCPSRGSLTWIVNIPASLPCNDCDFNGRLVLSN